MGQGLALALHNRQQDQAGEIYLLKNKTAESDATWESGLGTRFKKSTESSTIRGELTYGYDATHVEQKSLQALYLQSPMTLPTWSIQSNFFIRGTG